MSLNKTVGVINMAALVPTMGHKYLIDFAASFVDKLYVIICTRSFEPELTRKRVELMASEYYGARNVVFLEHSDDEAPQNDDGSTEFWSYWHNAINFLIPDGKLTHLFASEIYGKKFAEELGVEFIPVDIEREIVPISGTEVRLDLQENFRAVMPEFRKVLHKNICIFGAESTGKTTMANKLADKLGGSFIHEWTRPYLEAVGPELDETKMLNIVKGQWAAMDNAPLTELFDFRDTDLLSTIGYYKILGMEIPEELEQYFAWSKSDLYIVMNTDIPFEEDVIRYGGDKRESDTQFWIDLLEQYDCDYRLITETNRMKQFRQATKFIYEACEDLREIEEFVRD